MKIKKEYILLALLIASSVGYLIFQKTDRLHYTLPVLSAAKAGEITSIEITTGGKATILIKKDNAWLISPQDWRADQAKLTEMVEALANVSVTDLVSESGDYSRYQLDEKDKTLLKAYAGKTLVRELFVGKAAPTNNHTYVMLPGDKRVYLAGGDLPRLFLAPSSDLRDMVVLSIKPMEITRIEIEHKGEKSILVKSELPQDSAKEEPVEGKTKLFTWKNDRGATIDKAEIDAFLTGLSKVYCGEYLDDARKSQLTAPETTLGLTGSEKYSLAIFKKEGDNVPALSSQSGSPFNLPDYKFEEIEKSLNKILEN